MALTTQKTEQADTQTSVAQTSAVTTSAVTSKTATPSPGLDMLGKSYDTTGEYAHYDSVGSLLLQGLDLDVMTQKFTFDSYSYAAPACCEVLKSTPATDSFVSVGATHQEYASDTASKLHLSAQYGGCAGTINASHSSEVRASSSSYYATIYETITGYYLKLKDNGQDGRLKLQQDVQDALDDSNVDAKTLFGKYGTHVITGVIIGGQARFSAHGSKSTFETTSEFKASAQAKYSSMSGSAKYSTTTSTKQESVEASADVQYLGGQSSARYLSDGDGSLKSAWSAWGSTVPANPAVIGFPKDTLKPLWDFCTDESRKVALASEFERLYTPRRVGEKPASYGNTSKPKLYGVNAKDDVVLAKSADEYFVVGFGGNVNTNGNLNRVAIQFENTRTGKRDWWVDGTSGFDKNSYEKLGSVPPGCALVGLGIHATEGNIKHVKLSYQYINRQKPGKNASRISALDPTVYSLYLGGEKSSYDFEYTPSNNNTKLLGGLKVGIKDNKHIGFEFIESEFYLPIAGR
jgi:hypothetical protein